MDFTDMGRSDAMIEISESESGFLGDKTATIRLSSEYLELLNHIAPIVGISRQEFMSRIVMLYAVDAVADYFDGYRSVFHTSDVKDILPDDYPDSIKEHFENFVFRVEKEVSQRNLNLKGYRALPDDDADKLHHFEKYIRPTLKHGILAPNGDGTFVLLEKDNATN